MRSTWNIWIVTVMAALAAGCAASGKETWEDRPPNPAVEMQDRNIEMLTGYIEILQEQIAQMKEFPVPEDPVLAQVNATDLAGMELRVELLSIVLGHCRLAREKLLEAEAHPEKKAQLLEEFHQDRKQVMAQLEAIDLKMDAQERKRMELGMQMVEQALQ